MKRCTFAVKVKKGQMENYRRRLGEIWPELSGFLDEYQIHNFSIWNCQDLIFGYCESDDVQAESGCKADCGEKPAGGAGDRAEKIQALTARIEDTFDWISVPGQEMRLMYQNIGIVREKKELIRHRVFMTRLKPGCAEIYKARHDALTAERGDQTDPGPDSNFTIWNAGEYIFGYDEIDTTMEKEETEEARQSTISWETRQLEIMDWITNDVDWITGEHHASCVRLAWHG